MQNPEDRAREPLSDKSETPDQPLDLGQRICARYGCSPGVISTGVGPGLARQVVQFSERLPLLQTLHQRWKTDGVMSARPTGPVWLRALSSSKSKESAKPVVARVASKASAGGLSTELPASTAIRPQRVSSDLTAEGHIRRTTSHPKDQLHTDSLSAPESSRFPQESRHVERTDPALNTNVTALTDVAGLTGDAGSDAPILPNALHSAIATGGSRVAHPENAVASTVALTISDMHISQAPIAEMPHRSGDAALSDSHTAHDGVSAIPVRSTERAPDSQMLCADATVQMKEAAIASKKVLKVPTEHVTQTPSSKLISSSGDKAGTFSRMLPAVSSAAAVTGEGSAQAAQSATEGITHDSGDNIRGRQIRRTVRNKDGNENRAADLTAGVSRSDPPKTTRPAAGGDRKSSEAARGKHLDASISSQPQMGAPIFLRHTGGAQSRVNRQTVVAPDKGKASDAFVPVPLRTSELGSTVSRSKAEVTRSVTPILPRTQLTDNARQPGIQRVRILSNDAPSPARESFEETGPGMSRGFTRLRDQPDSLKPIVPADHSVAAGQVSANPPYVQREAMTSTPHLSEYSMHGSAVEDTAFRQDEQATISSSTTEGGPLESSAGSKANATVHRPNNGDVGVGADGGANLVQRYAENSITNSRPTTSLNESGKESVIHPHPLSSSPVRDQPDSLKPIVPADYSVAAAQVSVNPLYVQRKATMSAPYPNKNSGYMSGGEDTVFRQNEQAEVSSSTPEGGDLAQRYSENSTTNSGPTTSLNESGKTSVIHSYSLPLTPATVKPVVLASRIHTRGADVVESLGVSYGSTTPAKEVRRAQAEEAAVTTAVEASTSSQLIEASRRADTDEALEHRQNILPAKQFLGQPRSSITPDASPLLHRTIRNDDAIAVSFPNLSSAPKGFGKSEVTHHVERRADGASLWLQPTQGVTPSRSNSNVVQRSTASSAGGTSAQQASGLPSLPSSGTQTSQSLPPGDIAQLANRVYDLLVRRLATEKQRKGL